MNREEFLASMSELLKLVRTEYGLTQEVMAAILGMSRKSLVECEKGRRTLCWPEAAAISVIFMDSKVLNDAFGGAADEIVRALAFENIEHLGEISSRDGVAAEDDLRSLPCFLAKQVSKRVVQEFDNSSRTEI